MAAAPIPTYITHIIRRRAPAIAEPAGRKRRDAEQHVAGGHQHQQVAVAHVQFALERDHDGRIQQHEKMRVAVPDLGESERDAIGGGAAHRNHSSLGFRSIPSHERRRAL
jgi:hypothetical protein